MRDEREEERRTKNDRKIGEMRKEREKRKIS